MEVNIHLFSLLNEINSDYWGYFKGLIFMEDAKKHLAPKKSEIQLQNKNINMNGSAKQNK